MLSEAIAQNTTLELCYATMTGVKKTQFIMKLAGQIRELRAATVQVISGKHYRVSLCAFLLCWFDGQILVQCI